MVITLLAILSSTLAGIVIALLYHIYSTGKHYSYERAVWEAERSALVDRLLLKNGVAPLSQPIAAKSEVPVAVGHQTMRERQRAQELKILGARQTAR